eukprot:8414096-Pyramimonas_sp.AAC.1
MSTSEAVGARGVPRTATSDHGVTTATASPVDQGSAIETDGELCTALLFGSVTGTSERSWNYYLSEIYLSLGRLR